MKNCGKIKGVHFKSTHISVVKCPIAPKLILNQCLDTACLPNDPIHNTSNFISHVY